MDRRRRSATLLAAKPSDDGSLLHPFLAMVAVVFAWWDGRHAFHGGAFADAEDRAWAVLGQRGAGKSSTLAGLVLAGTRLLSDDLLVATGSDALAGPRFIDLRPDAAAGLAEGMTFPVRAGERRRLAVGSVSAALPINGWIFLTWGDSVELRRLGPAEWLERLAAHRNTVSVHAPSLLELAGAPAWELRRPRNQGSLEPAVERLLELVGR